MQIHTNIWCSGMKSVGLSMFIKGPFRECTAIKSQQREEICIDIAEAKMPQNWHEPGVSHFYKRPGKILYESGSHKANQNVAWVSILN